MSAWGPPPVVGRSGHPRAGTRRTASGDTPKSAAGLTGRDPEIAEIDRLLSEVRDGRPAALLLTGEAGIGKTALLHAARSRADGFRCLTASGIESESALAHAGLLELLTPLRPLLPEVPDGQAAALASALGWAPADAPADRFLVAAGTLSLLAAAAAEEPVLVLVDDLQWLDRESAGAIVFAARRLGADAVGFLMNARTDPATPAPDLARGLPILDVRALEPSDAAALVATTVGPAVAGLLAAATGGNPLAMVEVSAHLTPAQRVGAAALPDPLPVGDRLHTVYDGVLSRLTAEARHAVLLVALSRTGALVVAETRALDEAVAAGVLAAEPQGHRFQHPLLRAAVLRLATPEEQRRAHRSLAAALPPGAPGRAHHLAAASTGPDDVLADELDRVAAGDRVRLGYAASSLALERAAALTSDPATASARLAAAADDAFVAGDVARARHLVGRVLGSTSGSDPARGRALFALGMVEQYAGSNPRAAEHLRAASLTLTGAALVDALTELALVRFRLGDMAGFEDCAARIRGAVDRSDPAQRVRECFTAGVTSALAGDYPAARPMLAEVAALALSDALEDDPRSILLLALASGFTGTVAEALARGAVRVEGVRRRGAIGMLMPILAISASGRAMLGDHVGAYADAGEAAELAEHLGYAAEAAIAVEHLAWESAARGLHEEARSALARARTLLDRAETTSAAAHHALTVAFCALCRGEMTDVVDVLESRLEMDGGVGAMGEALGVAPLLVEAYVSLGRVAQAEDLARRLAAATPDHAPAELTAMVLRCQGLVAEDAAAARRAFDDALRAHAASQDLFEHARTRLMLGSRLRRDGRRVEAREHLQAAHRSFADMELSHWAGQAAAELRATGAVVRPRGELVDGDEPLTSQETRVALLVAEGRTNKDVAAALFLSPKTVERHLGNVFRKRGFRSRAELVRAYAQPD
jgi:DNA-binding NarL/FixJ family response regulator